MGATPAAGRPSAAFAAPAALGVGAPPGHGRPCCVTPRAGLSPPTSAAAASRAGGWAARGRARLPGGRRASPFAAPVTAPVRRAGDGGVGSGGGGSRTLKAALVNKKGSNAEESLGIPSAPADSELVPEAIPPPPPPQSSSSSSSLRSFSSRRSKKAPASDRPAVALPSLSSLKAPAAAPAAADDEAAAAAAMDQMASDAVKQLTADAPAANADEAAADGPVQKATGFLSAVRGEFDVVDWPAAERVGQILGIVVASIVLSSGGIYLVDKVFMKLSAALFGSEF